MKHFEWMVINKVDKKGIWFTGTVTGQIYIFWWNPLRNIANWLRGGAVFGWFPLHIKHIKI